MHNKLITCLLIAVGLINFIPIVGILSAEKLSQLYAISLKDPTLVLLMRHRALLFGIIGGFIIFAAFNQKYQPSAMLMGFISMLGFILLAWQMPDLNPAIQKIIYADVIGLILLSIAATLCFFLKNSN